MAKTLIAFYSHAGENYVDGSGLGGSIRQIKMAVPEANLTAGVAIHGAAADSILIHMTGHRQLRKESLAEIAAGEARNASCRASYSFQSRSYCWRHLSAPCLPDKEEAGG
ncbi:MAG: hypothetical protein IJ151_05335 [Bacteroidales bacterium]|nr:hypothetical protein [Bacteroidales bacterium]